ncbi:MAG: aminoacyl-tRNA hydrolase [Poseidonia sp.]|jgi:PTH2 family peptidyl-tRNA hydrolase
MSTMDDAPTMALLVRHDLNLSVGKVAAQCAHAAVDVVANARRTRLLERWRAGGARKIVLSVDDLEALNEVADNVPRGCFSHIVVDAGHTEVPAGTITVLGLLGPRRAVDALTGHLTTL